MLARLRIGTKLLLAPGLVLLLLIATSSLAWYALVRQNAAFEVIVQQRAVRIREVTDLVAEAHAAHSASYQLLTWISGSFSAARIDALTGDIQRRHVAVEGKLARLSDDQSGSMAERQFLQQAQEAHALYVKAISDVIEIAHVDQSIGANAMSKAERAFGVVALRLAELTRIERELSQSALEQAAADVRTVSTAMPLLVALSIVLSLAITFAVRRTLLKEVSDIAEAALGLANGNLTVTAREYGNDELSDTSRVLDSSIRNLNTTLKNILASARSMEALSATVSRGADSAQAARTLAGSGDVVMRMDQMSEQNSALVEQAAAAAKSLQHQALNLSRAVSSFKLEEAALPPREAAKGKQGHLKLASKRRPEADA